jgi:hypothetical protein
MQLLWPVFYAVFASFAVAAGAGMFGASYLHTNVDWVFVAVSFVFCLAFPPMLVSYACRRNSISLQRASFIRGVRGGWWSDPLQLLRVSILLLGGLVLGALFSLPPAGIQSTMVFWWQAAMLLGLIIGERVAYVLFRKQIT